MGSGRAQISDQDSEHQVSSSSTDLGGKDEHPRLQGISAAALTVRLEVRGGGTGGGEGAGSSAASSEKG